MRSLRVWVNKVSMGAVHQGLHITVQATLDEFWQYKRLVNMKSRLDCLVIFAAYQAVFPAGFSHQIFKIHISIIRVVHQIMILLIQANELKKGLTIKQVFLIFMIVRWSCEHARRLFNIKIGLPCVILGSLSWASLRAVQSKSLGQSYRF